MPSGLEEYLRVQPEPPVNNTVVFLIKKQHAPRNRKKYILSSDFGPVILFFVPPSVASTKHADTGPFFLLIRAYKNCTNAVSYLLEDPSAWDIFVPYIEGSDLLCNHYPLERLRTEKDNTQHAQEHRKFSRDAYPVCCYNHIPQPGSGRTG
jgi:hypothetical protein